MPLRQMPPNCPPLPSLNVGASVLLREGGVLQWPGPDRSQGNIHPTPAYAGYKIHVRVESLWYRIRFGNRRGLDEMKFQPLQLLGVVSKPPPSLALTFPCTPPLTPAMI